MKEFLRGPLEVFIVEEFLCHRVKADPASQNLRASEGEPEGP
jgi:hypothetical protein